MKNREIKFRIVTNGKEFSVERLSSYRKQITEAGLFSSAKYENAPSWIACGDLENESNFQFRAEGLGPVIMNLVRKKYPTYDQAKDSIEKCLALGEKENWSQVGEVFGE